MKNIAIVLSLLLSALGHSQTIEGTVISTNEEPLFGATLHWIGTSIGCKTGEQGQFLLSKESINDLRLIVRYIGFETDTVFVGNQERITIKLTQRTFDEVLVTEDRPDTYISNLNPIKTEVITQTELTKAACCDLAGCFDTQGSVQPTTTNIVTNAKELRILGLSGVYNQVLVDGMPLIMGTTYTYGISTIPGTLVDNIFISKGANSVLQGYESISGQINVELKEPDSDEKLLVNAYVNSFWESQFNVNYTQKLKRWNTILSAHTTQPAQKFDRDEDNFLDLPQLTRYSFYNKWKYGNQNEWGWNSRIGLRYVNEKRIGGQENFNPNFDKGSATVYGQTVNFSQPEIYTKTGYKMNDKHNFVLFTSAFYHKQNSYFGTTHFQADQTNIYGNIQHEYTWNKKHVLKSGLSYRFLELEETISFGNDTLNRTYDGVHLKSERIPGVFMENTFNWKDRDVVLVTGVRADMHNTHGLYVTPRALLKYNVTKTTTARISAGTGWRTINLFTENTNLLASSRDVIISSDLEPEQAINCGANLTQQYNSENVEVQISVDYYLTQFFNQIFPDYFSEPNKALIENFTGRSVSSSFQGELGLEFFDRVGIKATYNYLDVYRIVSNNVVDLPFNPTHRLTGTFSFKPLHEKWHFDVNTHFFGKQLLANTSANPLVYQTPDFSDAYNVLNAQLTMSWKWFDFYVGCENIFDFRQLRPIVAWQDPFSPYFDTSNVWGPTRGREIYMGVRFKLEKK